MTRMKQALTAIAAITILGVAGSMPAHGHHSHASLNKNDIRLYRGIISRYSWTMPHVFLKVRGPDPDGNVVEYTIETLNPPAMARAGWSRDTFKVGDEVIWEGPHDHNKARHYTGIIWMERVADGQRFTEDPRDSADIEPSTDFTGLWKRYPNSLKHYTPPEGWPMTDVGQAMIESFSEDDSPITNCVNPGPPKSMLLPFPVMITRPDEDHFVFERELMAEKRIIHLNHDHEPGEPSINGYSTGTFDGKELVVTTTNFVADKWGTHTGIDSSDQKQLVERFWMSDDGLFLHVDITITDPVYLTRPHTFRHQWAKLADRPVIQAPCTMESAQLYKEAGYGEGSE